MNKYRTRIRWLKKKDEVDNDTSTKNGDNATNLGTTDNSHVEPIIDAEASQDVQALLASALNICGDNDILRAQISTAINTSTDL